MSSTRTDATDPRVQERTDQLARELKYWPPCFTKQEYAEWQTLAYLSLDRMEMTTYCTDCLPGYQREMLQEERCTHPDVTFKKVLAKDGGTELIGMRPSKEMALRRKVVQHVRESRRARR